MQPFQDPFLIMNAKATDGIGTPMLVSDFNNVVLSLSNVGTTTLTIKFQVSYQKERPDFSAAQSPTNQWDYVRVVDLEVGSAIEGDTGVAYSGAAADTRNLEVDVNGAMWICAIISSRSGGSITLYGTAKNQ